MRTQLPNPFCASASSPANKMVLSRATRLLQREKRRRAESPELVPHSTPGERMSYLTKRLIARSQSKLILGSMNLKKSSLTSSPGLGVGGGGVSSLPAIAGDVSAASTAAIANDRFIVRGPCLEPAIPPGRADGVTGLSAS